MHLVTTHDRSHLNSSSQVVLMPPHMVKGRVEPVEARRVRVAHRRGASPVDCAVMRKSEAAVASPELSRSWSWRSAPGKARAVDLSCVAEPEHAR